MPGMRGAEAILSSGKFLGRNVVIKSRLPKSYRAKALDTVLRTKRTRQEARLLHKAKEAGVPCPVVFAVDDFSITMEKISGKRPSSKVQFARAGKYLASLHGANIVHGDYTPANLISNGNALYVIDFGLGFFSTDIEDKAIDVLTMLKSIDAAAGKEFLRGYGSYAQYGPVMKRIEQVKSRVRYAQE